MFDHIRNALNKNKKITPSQKNNHHERISIAACVVLLEVAHADKECSDDELDHVIEVMQKKFDVSEEYAHELIEVAHQERAEAVDLWQFTNVINKQFDKTERMEIMEAVWHIIYMDGKLEKHEDYFAHKLAKLFRLRHPELIEIKLKVRERVM